MADIKRQVVLMAETLESSLVDVFFIEEKARRIWDNPG